MGDLVNLRRVRKRKQRDQKARKADENRAAHGRTRQERDLSDARKRAAEKHLDGHQRAQEDANSDNGTDTVSTNSAAPMTSKSDEPENVVSIFGRDKPGADPV